MSSLSLVQSWIWTVTGWVNSCALIKVRSFCCTRGTHRVTVQRQNWTRLSEQHMSSLSLVQFCLWTVTRWVPLVQKKLLTFITAHEFTQPCSILSLNSETMGAPSAAETAVIKVRSFCCTRGTHRVTVQRQDWTRLSELMCSDKGKKFLLH
jgi:hypothetical protein